MNYGDHNFIEITQQTKLRVKLDFVARVSRLARQSPARRAVLFDNVDTAKMHGLDTSNVSSWVEPSGICRNFSQCPQAMKWESNELTNDALGEIWGYVFVLLWTAPTDFCF